MMIASRTLPRKDALRKHGRSPDMVARAELHIRYNGRHYVYRGYRYDRLADAVSYARLDRARSSEDDVMAAASAPFKVMPPPTYTEREIMCELAITFKDGVYRLRDYRYERLADAIAYAELRRAQVKDPAKDPL